MKKILLVSSFCLIAVWGLKLLPTPASAKTPIVVKQSNNSPSQPTTVQPQVELLNVGMEPRQKLRFKSVVNAKQTATITMNMDMAVSVAGKPTSQVKIPTTAFTMQTVVTKVDANGDMHYQFSYTDADVVAASTTLPKQVDLMRSRIKKMVGTKGNVVVDNQGRTKTASFVFPETLDTDMKQQMEQMTNSVAQLSSPVPEQAIGTGAKWQVSSSPKLSGINLTQLVTYQLVSLQNNIATLNVNVEQHAKQQNFTRPGMRMPSGTLIVNAQGQGQLTQPLHQLMPLRSAMSVRTNTEFTTRLTSKPENITIGTKLLMNISLQSN